MKWRLGSLKFFCRRHIIPLVKRRMCLMTGSINDLYRKIQELLRDKKLQQDFFMKQMIFHENRLVRIMWALSQILCKTKWSLWVKIQRFIKSNNVFYPHPLREAKREVDMDILEEMKWLIKYTIYIKRIGPSLKKQKKQHLITWFNQR